MVKVDSIRTERKHIGKRGAATGVGIEIQKLIDALPFYVLLVDAGHYIVLANEAVKRHLGVEPERIIGGYCPKVVHGIDGNFPGCPLEEAVGKGNIAIERELYDPVSGWWVKSAVYPTGYRTKEGRVIFIHFAQDITKHKQAEEAMHGSEEKYRSLVENVRLGVFRSTPGPTGRFLEVNPAVEEITGYSREELLQINVCDLFMNPEERESVLEEMALAKGRVAKELNFRKKDGTKIVVSDTKAPVRDSDGKVLYFDGILEDITERKQAEKIQSESEEEFQRLLDLIPIGVTMLDMKGVISYCNPTVYNKGGYAEGEFTGKHFSKIATVRAKEIPTYIRFFSSVVRGKTPKPFETIYRRKDGTTGWIELHIGLIRVGRKRRILVIQHDITERKQAEHDTRERLKELQCLYSISKISGRVEISLNEICQEVANLLPPSWQYPEITCSRIIINEDEFRTENYRDVDWRQCADIKVRCEKIGMVEVSYLEERPAIDEGPFLKEERTLINAVAEHLTGIIQRKQAEEELRRNEKQNRLLLESAGGAIYGLDTNGDCTFANPACLRLLGYDREEDVLGKNMHDLIHYKRPDGAPYPKEECKIYQAFRHGEGIHVDDEVLWRADGSSFPVEYWSHPMHKGGEIVGAVMIFGDITERKRAEEALQESEERYRALFDSTNDIVQSVAPDGSFIYVNKAWFQILGYSEAELPKLNMFNIIHPESLEHCQEIFARVMAGEYVNNIQATFISKDGKSIQVEGSASPRIIGDSVIATQGFFHDITERKKMEEKLIVTDRLASIGELASGIAHELNNPLTGVIGFSELLLEKDVPNEIREDIAIIHNEAVRAAEVVKNLLTFARKHTPLKQLVNINSIIASILGLRAYEQKVSNIKVVKRLASDMPEVMADSFQLQQVILNIVVNSEYSMQEMHRGGVLTIMTEREGDIIRATFTDDGLGISEEDLGHVFDPFFTTKEVGKGTGLGLSICHGIITEHGGRIHARSEIGKGASFIIELPISKGGKKGENR